MLCWRDMRRYNITHPTLKVSIAFSTHLGACLVAFSTHFGTCLVAFSTHFGACLVAFSHGFRFQVWTHDIMNARCVEQYTTRLVCLHLFQWNEHCTFIWTVLDCLLFSLFYNPARVFLQGDCLPLLLLIISIYYLYLEYLNRIDFKLHSIFFSFHNMLTQIFYLTIRFVI